MKCRAFLAALLLFARPSPAQLLSGTKYDPAIPTLKSVVGHDPGQEISTPDQIGRYLEALAKAAPDRTRLVHYATSWEGRPLHYLVVGSRERIARLDDIRRGMQVLGWVLLTRAMPQLPASLIGLLLLMQPALSFERSTSAERWSGTRSSTT